MIEDEERFGMFHIDELPRITALLRSADRPRRLWPHDCSVLIALMCHMDKNTYKVRVTQNQLAKDLGAGKTNISASMQRLRKEMLVASYYNSSTGERYFMLNPYLFSTGRTERRPMLYQHFKELIND